MNADRAADGGDGSGRGYRRYSFGDYSFDAHRSELLRDGRRIDLNPQPARLLEALLIRAPDIVTREALQNELWGGKATVEFEQSLNTCIGQLRAALGEVAREPVFIKTEPKMGYRFLVDVKTGIDESASPVRAKTILALVILVAVAFIAASQFIRKPASSGLLRAADFQSQEIILRARSLRKFGDTTAMNASLEQFESVLARDPHEAAALGGAALNLAVLAGTNEYSTTETYGRAIEMATQSIATNARAVDARLARGYVALYRNWDITAALDDFSRARELAPNYALAHSWLAAALAANGSGVEAVAASARAAELDPVSWYVNADRCWYLVFDYRYQDALVTCAAAVEQEPDRLWSKFGLIEAQRGSGDFESAAALLNEVSELAGLSFSGKTPADTPDLKADWRFAQKACQLADRLVERSASNSVPSYLIASLYAQCGEFDNTSPWLQDAVSGGESFVLFYDTDPRFDEYRASTLGRASAIVVEKR